MAIEELARWFQTWRIEVNAEKSAAISFIYRKAGVQSSRSRYPSLRINNTPIPWQHTYKYLGITLDEISTSETTSSVSETTIFYQSRQGMLGRNSKLHYAISVPSTNVHKDGADIRISVFAHRSEQTQKLQVLQNKFCRTATNAHWCVKTSPSRDLDLPSIRKYAKDAPSVFLNRGIAPESATLSSSLYEAPPPITLSVGHGILSPIRLTISQSKSGSRI
ncbi:RNA-directed DNA polymerase from mobile element jockey [Eumeta japonica]|uniref:RNA-directed DNA polymerase from mobile element jockey n=1 Tax=Eumeta variegata TaxID=151549 RepID=A0A4C1VQQ9_EUMVA|nr:RNA-directed DNA polymerase from mobile element jockey [Eumeta japonica]